MRIGRRMAGAVLAALMLTALVPEVMAATREDLEQPGVFMDQEYSGACVITSTTMMLRRGAILRGDDDWSAITTSSVPHGMPYEFTVDGMTVEKASIPGGKENRAFLADMLEEHPEGVVLYARGVPHAVLLTDYTDGQFYCCDPAVCCPTERIPIEEAYGTRIENSGSIWYITSKLPGLEEETKETLPVVVSLTAPCESVADLVGLEDE